MSVEHLWLDSSILWEIDGLHDESDGSFINDATATLTVYDEDDVAVTGATNLAFTYITGSDGKYRVTIPSTVVFIEHASYTVGIDIVSLALALKYRTPAFARYKHKRDEE